MRTSPADAELIVRSLEIAAERAGDLTGRVYERLFERQPEMRSLFWRDSDGAIKGEMLSRVFEAILDFVGARRYAHRMIQSEAINHEGLDVPREAFRTFFEIVCDAVAEACGAEWTAAMAAAWRRMLNQLDFYMRSSGDYVA